MASLRKTLALAALITSATALFPDCVNGPLKNNTVCDYTKGKQGFWSFVKLANM